MGKGGKGKKSKKESSKTGAYSSPTADTSIAAATSSVPSTDFNSKDLGTG